MAIFNGYVKLPEGNIHELVRYFMLSLHISSINHRIQPLIRQLSYLGGPILWKDEEKPDETSRWRFRCVCVSYRCSRWILNLQLICLSILHLSQSHRKRLREPGQIEGSSPTSTPVPDMPLVRPSKFAKITTHAWHVMPTLSYTTWWLSLNMGYPHILWFFDWFVMMFDINMANKNGV